MPVLSQGNTANLTLGAHDSITLQNRAGQSASLTVAGTLVNGQHSGTRTYGPYTNGGAVVLVATAGDVYYEVADGQTTGAPIEVESVLRRFGAVFDGVADDTPALQQTIDWFAATYPRSVLRFPNMANQRARLASTLFIDMAKTAIDFSQLELRPAAGVTALQLTGTDEAVHPQAAMFLQNFHIVGPGRDIAGTRGIFHHNPDGVLMGKGASRYALRNFSISQCDIGEEYGNTAWGIGHYGWSIFEFNTAGIRVGAGYPDGYELPVYYGGALLNGINGIDLQRGQLTFIGSSLDYIRKFGTIQNGRVHLIACHQETNKRRASYPADFVPWTISNNGAMLVKGGRIVMSEGQAGANQMTHWVENNNTSALTSGYAMFDSVSIQNVDTSTKYFAKGTGAVYARRCVVEINGGSAVDSIIKGLHETRSTLSDGGFEIVADGTGNFVDEVFVRGGTITSRSASSSLTLTAASAAARSGSRGLLATKLIAAGASGTADIYIARRVTDHASQYGAVIRLRSPNSTAQVTVEFLSFNGTPVTAGSDIVPQPRATTSLALNASGAVTLSSSWVERHAAASISRPTAGHEYVGWRIRAHNLGANEVIHIDDVEIHAW